ncbi:MAG: histidine kinase [Chloroflexota bacterium]|nr:histidine kinase [Chloroflexota bacterium]
MGQVAAGSNAHGESRWVRFLLPVLATLWLGELAAPLSQLLRAGRPPGLLALALVGAALFVTTYLWTVRDAIQVRGGAQRLARPRQLWTPPVVLAVLSVLLSIGYGPAWLGLFIFASVGSALRLPTSAAARVIVGLTLAAGVIGMAEGAPLSDLVQGGLLVAGIGAVVATVGYSIRASRELRAARAEIAQLAISQERLRFARDLHDLLGQSLSLVALKCDLADQLLGQSADQARHEIQEAASITRQALRDVRAAVAGYRRPTLAQELAGAQEMLAAAGIGVHVEAAPLALPSEREAALAWALREGVTNVIRHSRAQRCVIRLRRAAGRATLEVVDDGCEPSSASAGASASASGSGLAGLAERLSGVGGAVQANAVPEGGFCLAAWVPLAEIGAPDVVAAQPRAGEHT